MDLALLRTFVTVHRAGSFTRAAALLGLSQPAVTSQIRTLERQLGRPLFLRQARGVTPTTIGRRTRAQGRAASRRARGDRRDRARRGLLPTHTASRRATGVHRRARASRAHRADRRRRPGLRAARLLRQRRGNPGGAGGRASRSGHQYGPSARRPAHRDSALRRGARPGRRAALGRARSTPGSCAAGALRPGEPPRGGGARVAALRLPLLGLRLRLPPGRLGHRHRPRPARGARLRAAGAGLAVLPRYLCAPALERGDVVALLDPAVPPLRTYFLVVRTGTLAMPHIARAHEWLLRAAADWG
jgi:DNA-binding transcriptional LysR family regulator